MLRKMFLGVGLAIALATPALADGPYARWSGLYVGGSVGQGWADVDVTNAAGAHFYIPGTVYSFSGSDVIYGGHLGFQHQMGRWVAGVEVSLSKGVEDTLVAPGIFAINTYSVQVSSIFTATAKLGYASDRWLGYVKGGFASAEVRTFATEAPSFAHFGNSSERQRGYTIGAGIEYQWLPGVILGAEYNFIDLGDRTHVGFDNTAFSTYSVRVDPEIHTVSARLTFLLGRQEAAPLK